MYFDQDVFFRFLGVLGFGCYVLNYWLLSCRALTSENKRFFALNILAASLVLVSNYVDFNLASVMIQVFWIIIGIIAILTRRKPNQNLSSP